jgi:hypothetical protein
MLMIVFKIAHRGYIAEFPSMIDREGRAAGRLVQESHFDDEPHLLRCGVSHLPTRRSRYSTNAIP